MCLMEVSTRKFSFHQVFHDVTTLPTITIPFTIGAGHHHCRTQLHGTGLLDFTGVATARVDSTADCAAGGAIRARLLGGDVDAVELLVRPQ